MQPDHQSTAERLCADAGMLLLRAERGTCARLRTRPVSTASQSSPAPPVSGALQLSPASTASLTSPVPRAAHTSPVSTASQSPLGTDDDCETVDAGDNCKAPGACGGGEARRVVLLRNVAFTGRYLGGGGRGMASMCTRGDVSKNICAFN
ncbi:hypothetical protein PF005_g3706 [Phytophthora fragariae]|uniref:Uncharacterized protein n=1 Tax=Phytophthora fragariae TaxID=53985 RepID=A0A6A3UNG6_9STRA|nr:hypothetical protein PF003_g21341 [Phytophthora fragariae]KAE8946387.1 hypothetical protein PF009_g3985 [Phytophthora fragariae]KAE9024317.1 hypothetical protein PF011_g3560 [Phytophthora fragariae]KAE9152266.1 hypothetical protein PF006_g3511 [Phytophthora fragariae]KAE9229843.1 hypothetical protein PF005_g3706 [Phytophthora fragariae]